MLARQSLALLGIALVAACSSSSVPRRFAVPAGAQNPLVIQYNGASAAEMTNIVAQMCSGVPISTGQVVPDKGYVETRWVDIAQFNLGSQTAAYPLQERQVIYVFQAQERGEDGGVLQIGGWYQPTRPPGSSPARDSRYDRFIPTGHPGYQLMLQFEFRLKQYFVEKGITVVEQEKTEGQ
jgi:hypothetical protein